MQSKQQPGRDSDGSPDKTKHARTQCGRRGKGRRCCGGKCGRARRGEARYVLLDVLRDGPKHGYEIIKTLEERSAGQYVPSPGTVYPTLQYLEDQGLVRANQEAERRVYQLTDAGAAEWEAQSTAIAAFWSRFAPQDLTTASQYEIDSLVEELEHLNQIVWGGLNKTMTADDHALIRSVRHAVEACQNQVREIIADHR